MFCQRLTNVVGVSVPYRALFSGDSIWSVRLVSVLHDMVMIDENDDTSMREVEVSGADNLGESALVRLC